jgi:hypothetical protein
MKPEGESSSGDGPFGFGLPVAARPHAEQSAVNCLSAIVSDSRLSSLRFRCSGFVLSVRPHSVESSLRAKW